MGLEKRLLFQPSQISFRMDHIVNQNSKPSKADKKKQKVARKGGQSNEGLDLEEEFSDDERDKKTAL